MKTEALDERIALTEEQRSLAADNHNLIYKFASIKEVDIDEYYGLFAIGLCKAAKLFDASHGFKFSTLAYRCMETEYRAYWRHELCSRHIPLNMLVSYNIPIGNDDGDSEMLDVLSNDASNSINNDQSKIEVEEFFKELKPMQRLVLNGLMEGYRESDLAEYIGCTKQNISRIKMCIKDKWIQRTKPEFYIHRSH